MSERFWLVVFAPIFVWDWWLWALRGTGLSLLIAVVMTGVMAMWAAPERRSHGHRKDRSGGGGVSLFGTHLPAAGGTWYQTAIRATGPVPGAAGTRVAPGGYVGELLIGEVFGFRVWSAFQEPERQGVLLPAFYPVPYPWARENNRALCAAGADHPAPDARCSCGFWGVYNPAQVIPACYDRAVESPGPLSFGVPGLVKGWGRVVIGDRGWRAQYAKPVALLRPPESVYFLRPSVEAAARSYGAALVDHWRELYEFGTPEIPSALLEAEAHKGVGDAFGD